MTLRGLRIRDFQSIANLEIHPGRLTVLTGPSNSGKSAVVRAIRAVAENVQGTAAVRAGAKTFAVTLDVDGHEVRLTRGPGLGEYHLDDQRFAKSGKDVPPEVTNVLKITKGDPNITTQFDRPFLLDAPGTEVARVLGELTNADQIQRAVKEANRRLLETRRTAGIRAKDLETIEKALENLGDLDALEEHVTWLEKLIDGAEATADQLLDLNRLIVDIEAGAEHLRSLARPPTVPDELLVLADRDLWKLDRLRRAIDELAEAQTDVDAWSTPVPEVPAKVLTDATLTLHALSRLKTAADALERFETERATYQAEARRLREEEARLLTEYHDTLKELGRCPMCNQPVA